jgi:AbrB family looped-hinge helix DNA binding protein
MKITTFVTEVKSNYKIDLPAEIREKQEIDEGDKVEITLKKIKSRRLEILISENPLYKLITFTDK